MVFKQKTGSRAQVMHGTAKMTGGGLKKKDLKYNKHGKIVSKKLSAIAKKEKRLQKAGWTTIEGQFGAMQIGGGKNLGKDKPHGRALYARPANVVPPSIMRRVGTSSSATASLRPQLRRLPSNTVSNGEVPEMNTPRGIQILPIVATQRTSSEISRNVASTISGKKLEENTDKFDKIMELPLFQDINGKISDVIYTKYSGFGGSPLIMVADVANMSHFINHIFRSIQKIRRNGQLVRYTENQQRLENYIEDGRQQYWLNYELTTVHVINFINFTFPNYYIIFVMNTYESNNFLNFQDYARTWGNNKCTYSYLYNNTYVRETEPHSPNSQENLHWHEQQNNFFLFINTTNPSYASLIRTGIPGEFDDLTAICVGYKLGLKICSFLERNIDIYFLTDDSYRWLRDFINDTTTNASDHFRKLKIEEFSQIPSPNRQKVPGGTLERPQKEKPLTSLKYFTVYNQL